MEIDPVQAAAELQVVKALHTCGPILTGRLRNSTILAKAEGRKTFQAALKRLVEVDIVSLRSTTRRNSHLARLTTWGKSVAEDLFEHQEA
jgi:hypothetical protein